MPECHFEIGVQLVRGRREPGQARPQLALLIKRPELRIAFLNMLLQFPDTVVHVLTLSVLHLQPGVVLLVEVLQALLDLVFYVAISEFVALG